MWKGCCFTATPLDDDSLSFQRSLAENKPRQNRIILSLYNRVEEIFVISVYSVHALIVCGMAFCLHMSISQQNSPSCCR